MSIEHLSGKHYGPVGVDLTAQRVGAYVAATHDDPARWRTVAPPSIASVALFAVAPEFLFGSDVGQYSRILLHSDQTFRWHKPILVGSDLAVSGVVERVRERGGMAFVNFGASIVDTHGEVVIESESTFIMSPDAPPGGEEDQPEPTPHERAELDSVRHEPLPALGGPVPQFSRSASRSDLVRYASASSDFNPIHWDHETARSAGLPRVICHGLLLAAWMFQAASRHTDEDLPLIEASMRFKRPVLAGDQALITGTVEAMDASHAELALNIAAHGEPHVTGKVRLAR